MEGFVVLDSEKDAPRDKFKVDKMEKACSGSAARKRLADISNLPMRPKPLTQDEKSRSNSATVKDYIEQLQKENAVLTKLLADRNKIIEVSGVELQKLRVNLQKMQLQNMQLAQANSQLLAELNSGKDKQKVLHHELGCINGLLIAQKLESEGYGNSKRCQKLEMKVEETKLEENGMCSLGDRGVDKPCSSTRRQQSKSLGPSIVQDKEKVKNKRVVTRRQSARVRQEEPECIEILDAIDLDKMIPVDSSADIQMKENTLNPISVAVKIEDVKDDYIPSIAQDKEKVENKRLVTRRQSARVRQEEPECIEKLDAIDIDKKILVESSADIEMQENILNPISMAVKNERKDDYIPSIPQDKEKVENKRLVARRQSARVRQEEPESIEQLDEIDHDKKIPVDSSADVQMQDNILNPISLAVKNEDRKDDYILNGETGGTRRSSISRPSRQATKKVQSYKEPQLKTKMRRTE